MGGGSIVQRRASGVVIGGDAHLVARARALQARQVSRRRLGERMITRRSVPATHSWLVSI
jgi:hypothetical protein